MQVLFLMIAIVVIAFAFCGLSWALLNVLGMYKEMLSELKMKQSVKKVIVERKIDHEPFIRTCIEIVRMKKRIEKMETKDKRHLVKSLERLEEYFKEKGYEIISYEGVAYHEGMNLKVSFVPSEELEKGSHIITKVIKPQINYQNAMIHVAEVEVSVGE